MRKRASARVCLGLAVGLFATGSPAPGQSAGLEPPWDVRNTMVELAKRAERLKPILDQVKPSEWMAKGAPETYIAQHKNLRAEVDYLIRSTGELGGDPERLTVALEVLFRLEAVGALLDSLSDGIRKYQNAALADLLTGVLSESGASREKLRQYIVDLAATKEQQFKVADQEAQRCRGMIMRQAPPSSRSDKRTEPK